MSTEASIPTYNLKAVIQETGIKPDTLRAWERRYGMPQPERTSGGHRLFSQRDIETIKWLMARQAEGLSISRAVDLWRSIESDGGDPLVEMEYPSPPQMTSMTQVGGEIEDLRSEWIEACKRFDEQGAQNILNQAFAQYPPEVVCLDLLTPALSMIGDGWYETDVTIQQEHFASEQATRRIEALIAASPPPTLPGRVLVICPPGEEHTFSPLLITFLIKRSGREAIFLGANVPLDRLDEAVTSSDPKLAILSAQQLHTAAALRRMAIELSNRDVAVAYGGRIFNIIPSLQERIPGTFIGAELREVAAVVDRLIRSPSTSMKIEEPSIEYQAALDEFVRKQPQIVAYIWEHLSAVEAPYNHISLANINLAMNIEAALELGDVAFLGQDIAWVRGLLGNHSMPNEVLNIYLQIYIDALENVMDETGKLITQYLYEVIQLGDGIAESEK